MTFIPNYSLPTIEESVRQQKERLVQEGDMGIGALLAALLHARSPTFFFFGCCGYAFNTMGRAK